MIRLAERNVFIRNNEGVQEPFCLDELRPLIQQALQQSVIQDDFLIDDILFALDIFLNQRHQAESLPSIKDIHILLHKVLCDNGFSEAAEQLLLLTCGEAEPLEQKLRAFLEEMSLPPSEFPELISLIVSRLHAAAYEVDLLSERFLKELVREEWRLFNRRKDSCRIEGALALPRTSLRELIALEQARHQWDWAKMRILGGGYLFRSLQVHFDLPRIIADLEFPPLSEILLRNCMNELLEALRPALLRALEHIAGDPGRQSDSYLSIHVLNVKTCLQQLDKSQAEALKQSLSELLQNFFEQEIPVNCPVKYIFV